MSNLTKISLGGIRNYAKGAKFAGEPGVKYGMVTYYPKTKDHEDPPIVPTKLFMVQRIKPFKGNPWWDKDTLARLRLDGRKGDIAVVKNTPEMNAMLWTVKHLIKVTPIKCPDGLPEKVDLGKTYLHENGTFMANHRTNVDTKRIKAVDEFVDDWKKMDKDTLRRQLRLKWDNPL